MKRALTMAPQSVVFSKASLPPAGGAPPIFLTNVPVAGVSGDGGDVTVPTGEGAATLAVLRLPLEPAVTVVEARC